MPYSGPCLAGIPNQPNTRSPDTHRQYPEQLKPRPRGPLDVLSALVDDLQKVPETDRPRRRYLTLVHLSNDRRSESELETQRQLFGKRSLS